MKSAKPRRIKPAPEPAAAVPPNKAPSVAELIKQAHQDGGEQIDVDELADVRRRAMDMDAIFRVRHPEMPLAPSARRLVLKERHGKSVVRIAGRAGADLKDLPLGAWINAQEAAFLTAMAKLDRSERLRGGRAKAISTRERHAQELKAQVLALAVKHEAKGHYLNGFIAKKLGIDRSTVRKIRGAIKKCGTD